MAISAATAWEVRTTGSATNGGGFVAGASGTDYSQQAAAQVAVTNAVANGTTTITSATASFSAAHVGNIIYLAGGSGSLAATRRQVVTFTNSTTIVVDATVATGTGITLNLGGALDGLGTLSGAMVGSNKAFIATGTYSQTATATFSIGVVPSATVPTSRLIGYYQARGDLVSGSNTNAANRPVISLATNTGLTAINITGTGWSVENMAVNCNSLGTSTGIGATGNYARIRNCKVSNFTTAGMTMSGSFQTVVFNEITAGTSAATAALNITTSTHVANNNIHNNACVGIITPPANNNVITDNLVTNNTGATSDGIQCSWGNQVRWNTCHGNGRHGINLLTTNVSIGMVVTDNLLTSNGGYGLAASGVFPADPFYDGNAYWNNTSGTRSNLDDVAGINAVAPYTNTFDVTLTADPYVDKTNDDYRLNSTGGGGAACRGFGVPQSWPGNSLTTSSPDMGASQSQCQSGPVFMVES